MNEPLDYWPLLQTMNQVTGSSYAVYALNGPLIYFTFAFPQCEWTCTVLLLNMIICIDFAVERQGTLAEAYMTKAVLVRYKHEEQMKVRETAARWRFYQHICIVVLLSQTAGWWRFYQINSHMVALLSNKQSHGGASINTAA